MFPFLELVARTFGSSSLKLFDSLSEGQMVVVCGCLLQLKQKHFLLLSQACATYCRLSTVLMCKRD